MGKIYILLGFMVASVMAYSQTTSKLTKAEYDMHISFKSYPFYESKLIFSDTSSIFIYKSKQEGNINKVGQNGNNLTVSPDKTLFVIFNDINSNKIKEIRSSDEKIGMASYKSSLKWNFVNDTIKSIGNYKCKFAHARYKGRLYYAWYNPEIPVSFGPWKLQGLPGLIMEAGDESNDIHFLLKKISSTTQNLPNFGLEDYNFYTKKKFDSIVDAKFHKKVKNLRSKMPRGVKVSYEIGKEEEIEKHP